MPFKWSIYKFLVNLIAVLVPCSLDRYSVANMRSSIAVIRVVILVNHHNYDKDPNLDKKNKMSRYAKRLLCFFRRNRSKSWARLFWWYLPLSNNLRFFSLYILKTWHLKSCEHHRTMLMNNGEKFRISCEIFNLIQLYATLCSYYSSKRTCATHMFLATSKWIVVATFLSSFRNSS